MKCVKGFKWSVLVLFAATMVSVSSTAWGLLLTRVYSDYTQIVREQGDGSEAGDGSLVGFFSDNSAHTLVNATTQNWATLTTPDKWLTFTTAWDNMIWSDTYLLEGDPGQSATISLDYDLFYDRVQVAAFGTNFVKTSVSLNWTTMPPYDDWQHFTQSHEKLWAFGFEFSDGHLIGNLSLGSLAVGDYLYLNGVHEAYSESGAPICLISRCGGEGFMVSTFDYALSFDEILPSQIPEPGSFFLLVLGSIILIGRHLEKGKRGQGDF